MPVHRDAAHGYQAGAETYDRGRPDYAPAALDWLRDTLGVAPGRTVVDLGAGTGKFTRRLAETGASVVAVEPVAAMRAVLAAALPDVDARDGTAESIPLADASADVVVCAQSFHWFATRAALDEMARVLRPGGRLGLIWNVRDERVDWVARLSAIIAPYEGDAPRYYTGAWRRVFPHDAFAPLADVSFPNDHTGPAERVIVDRTLSVSFIAALPRATQDDVAARVRALIAREPAVRDRAEVTFPYVTAAFAWTRR